MGKNGEQCGGVEYKDNYNQVRGTLGKNTGREDRPVELTP